MRPKHNRMAVFLRKQSELIFESSEMDYVFSRGMGVSYSFDHDRAWERATSLFASKFGIGLKKAVNNMIDLYGVAYVNRNLWIDGWLVGGRLLDYQMRDQQYYLNVERDLT